MPQFITPPRTPENGDGRYCRTYSLVSELFSHAAPSGVVAQAWAYNALAWEQLGALRARMSRERAFSRRLP